MEKAGFLTRFIAWFVDGLMIGILSWVVALIFGVLIGLTGGADNSFLNFISGTLAVMLILVMLLFNFLYFGYFWSKDGQSLGMKLVNIKVVRQDGSPLSFLRAGFRGTVGYWISGLVFGLGYIWAAFDARKEAWHDKIFDTWVVTA